MSRFAYFRAIFLVGICLGTATGQAMTLALDQHATEGLKTAGVIESVNRQAGTLVIQYSDATGAPRRATLRVPDKGLLAAPQNQLFRFVAEVQNGELVLLAILPSK